MKNLFLFLLFTLFLISCGDSNKQSGTEDFDKSNTDEQKTDTNLSGDSDMYSSVIEERMTPEKYDSAPKKGDLPFEAYDNSIMLRWGNNSNKGKSFLIVTLVTSDELSTVIDHYSRILDGWAYDETFGAYLKDADKGYMKTSMVTIGTFEKDFHPDDAPHLSDPKTLIEIFIEK